MTKHNSGVTDSPRQADAKHKAELVGAIGDERFTPFDCALDRRRYLRERRNDWLVWKDINFGEEYIRGRLDILLVINPKTGGCAECDRATAAGRLTKDRIDFLSLPGCGKNQEDTSDVTYLKNRGDDGMLVSVVELVKSVECAPLTRRVSRQINKKILGVLSGCYHSSRRGFEIHPRIPEGEFGMAILCSTIQGDQFPDKMIEGAPVVVNGVPQDDGNFDWQRLVDQNLDQNMPNTPTIFLTLDGRSVGARVCEGSNDLIEITEVMVGPL